MKMGVFKNSNNLSQIEKNLSTNIEKIPSSNSQLTDKTTHSNNKHRPRHSFFNIKPNILHLKDMENIDVEKPPINKSTLYSCDLTDIKLRKDFKGTPIVKGSHEHRIGFRDLVSKKSLVDYIKIESFKINTDSISGNTEKKEDNDNTSCSCIIY